MFDKENKVYLKLSKLKSPSTKGLLDITPFNYY